MLAKKSTTVHVWEIMGLLLGKNRKFVSDLTNIGHWRRRKRDCNLTSALFTVAL